MMTNSLPSPSLWNVSMRVAPEKIPLYRHVLECICESVSWDEDPHNGTLKLEGIWVDRSTPPVTTDIIIETVTHFCKECQLEVPSSLTIQKIEDKNWLQENEESFPPQTIGKFFIYGSHHQDEAPDGLIPIHLDAALAFGSGHHATTQGCLIALSALHPFTPKTALDMGCGSGILAIAMAKLFDMKEPVIAVDIDPFSTTTTFENCQQNNVESLVSIRLGDGYKALDQREKFDLVTANILANPLCIMAPDLAHHLTPKGYAILSGLLDNQAPSVIEAHVKVGLVLTHTYSIEGWSTLVFQKP